MSATFVSLFSGIGGGDLGFERAGFRPVANAEVAPIRCQVLAHHWPGVPNLGDVESIDIADVPAADVFLVSDPCQCNTTANTRWRDVRQARHLWPAALRVLAACRPTFVIRENPTNQRKTAPGLHATVARQLEEIGYVCTTIDAQCGEVSGVSRQRTFVCAGLGAAGKRFRDVLAQRRCDKGDWPAHGSPAMPFAALTTAPNRYGNQDNFILYPDGRIRVLSQRERIAAQGFPEGWLDCLPRQRLYTVCRLTGDAWPVFAAEWLGNRILEARALEGKAE